MKSFVRNHPIIFGLALILIAVTLTGIVSVRTDGFNDPGALVTRQLNEDNLLKIGDEGNYTYDAGKTIRESNGLNVTFNDNGSVTVNGDTSTEFAATDYTIATVTLPAGTYTLTSGKNGVSTTSTTRGIWLSVNNADNNTVLCNGDFGGAETNGTFTLEAETTVDIVLNVYSGEYNSVTVYPVLVKGEEAGGFYA